MDIKGTDISKALAANVESASTSKTSNQKKGVDQTTFMNLLVAQLKNQDPLAPQDGAQFVAQLAQFNSLEQLISINQRLGQVIDSKTVTTSEVLSDKK